MFTNPPENPGKLLACAVWLGVIATAAALLFTLLAGGPG